MKTTTKPQRRKAKHLVLQHHRIMRIAARTYNIPLNILQPTPKHTIAEEARQRHQRN